MKNIVSLFIFSLFLMIFTSCTKENSLQTVKPWLIHGNYSGTYTKSSGSILQGNSMSETTNNYKVTIHDNGGNSILVEGISNNDIGFTTTIKTDDGISYRVALDNPIIKRFNFDINTKILTFRLYENGITMNFEGGKL